MNRLFLILLLTIPVFGWAQETITFPSKDQVTITGDLYNPNPSTSPFIILFHQAGWSRGEYLEIAPKLNELGFNCLAIDQRSGGGVNDVTNQTNAAAKQAGKKTSYLDAFQDIEATVSMVKEKYAEGKVIAWGSSYSSSLVLKYAGDYPDYIDGVLAFSPGEYFKSASPTLIAKSAANIKIPAFITSAKNERGSWQSIYDAIAGTNKQFYLPESKGNHGSRALWEKFSDNGGYWNAVQSFLKQFS